jgi:membrane-associated phospholipid phosphatase
MRKVISLLLFFLCCLPLPARSSDSVERAGDVLQVVIPVAAFGMTFLFDDAEGRLPFFKSFATAMGTTYALKYALNYDRPGGGSKAFPSGHTSAAFSGASFIQRRYGWDYGFIAYAAASFVGWSRVHADEHHWDDVLAGAAIGIISTYIFTKPFEGNLQVGVIHEPGLWGVALSGRW